MDHILKSITSPGRHKLALTEEILNRGWLGTTYIIFRLAFKADVSGCSLVGKLKKLSERGKNERI